MVGDSSWDKYDLRNDSRKRCQVEELKFFNLQNKRLDFVRGEQLVVVEAQLSGSLESFYLYLNEYFSFLFTITSHRGTYDLSITLCTEVYVGLRPSTVTKIQNIPTIIISSSHTFS